MIELVKKDRDRLIQEMSRLISMWSAGVVDVGNRVHGALPEAKFQELVATARRLNSLIEAATLIRSELLAQSDGD